MRRPMRLEIVNMLYFKPNSTVTSSSDRCLPFFSLSSLFLLGSRLFMDEFFLGESSREIGFSRLDWPVGKTHPAFS